MALTRKFLSAMGIEPDQIDEIISAHSDTIDGLKEERDEAKRQAEASKTEAEKYKSDAEKLSDVQKELDDLKNANGKNIFEEKLNAKTEEFDKLKTEFDEYKAGIEAETKKQAKDKAYRQLLKDTGVSEKRIDSIMKVTDLDKVEVDKEGKVKDAENHTKTIKEEWADFITTERQAGADISNPPGRTGGAPGGESRAARLVAQYRNEHYGNPVKED